MSSHDAVARSGVRSSGAVGWLGLGWVLFTLLVPPVTAATALDEGASTSELEWQLLEAETAVAQGEPRLAASHYRAGLREAWYLLGLIEVGAGNLERGRDALGRARDAAAVDLARARIALALVDLRLGEIEKPLRELRLTAQEDPRDVMAQRRFAEALWALGRDDELVPQLEILRELDPSRADELSRATGEIREAPLPDADGLGAAAARERLRSRLMATLARVLRNLGHLRERVGGEGGDLRKVAQAVVAGHPQAGEPFGRIDLSAEAGEDDLGLPRLDPVALLASAPPSLHPALALVDAGDPSAAGTELRRRAVGEHAGAARALLGRLLAEQGDLEAAERELHAAITADPGQANAHQDLARLLWRDARRAEAVRHLRLAAELGDLDRDLSRWLARIETDAGHEEAARRQLRSLDKRFGSVEALLQLAQLELARGHEKRALEAAERATRLAPNSEDVLATHARLAIATRIVGSAARSVEPLVRMCPGVAEYRLLLGETWALRGKMGEAAEAFAAALELDAGYLPAMLPLGLALNHESRFAEARASLDRYLEAHPEDLDALAALAESEQRLGERESAERRARAVLERAPDNPRALLVIGLVRAGEGDFGAARKAFERAVDGDSSLAKAHYQLSLACARLGDRDCARQHLALYQQALAGPEASYVELERVAQPTLMQRQKPSGDGPSR